MKIIITIIITVHTYSVLDVLIDRVYFFSFRLLMGKHIFKFEIPSRVIVDIPPQYVRPISEIPLGIYFYTNSVFDVQFYTGNILCAATQAVFIYFFTYYYYFLWKHNTARSFYFLVFTVLYKSNVKFSFYHNF